MTVDPLNQEYRDALEAYLAEGYGPGVCARLIRVQEAEHKLNQRAYEKFQTEFVEIALKVLKENM